MRAWRVPVLLACALGGLASCTFLIPFDEVPASGCDAGACEDATTSPPDDAQAAGDAPETPDVGMPADADAGADAARDAVPDARPCQGLSSGFYCATNGPKGYPGSPDDLLRCEAGAVAAVWPCDGGCVAMRNPFPDICNPCPGRAAGVYCGRDIPSVPAEDSDFLLGCSSGNLTTNYPCPRGCKSNGAAASCYP